MALTVMNHQNKTLTYFIKAGRSLCLGFLCLLPVIAVAQNFTVKTSVDTNTLLIGQQRNLKVSLTASKNFRFTFPLLKDSLGKIEILSASKIDTLANDNANISLQQNYVITCWDTGYIPVQPITVAYKQEGDTTNYTAASQAFLLTVNTVAVDTTKAIRDIKPPVELPYTWEDFLPYIIGILIFIAVVVIAIYVSRKFKAKAIPAAVKELQKPPHVIALAELEKLKEEKIWQQGNFKLYHTRLTDIIRAYIERRYKINALEFTTDEILQSAEIKKIHTETFLKLDYLLRLADMVKFAKALPVPSENETCLSYAFDFVNDTKSEATTETELKQVTA